MIRFVLGFADSIPIGVLVLLLVACIWLSCAALIVTRRYRRDLRRETRIKKGRCA